MQSTLEACKGVDALVPVDAFDFHEGERVPRHLNVDEEKYHETRQPKKNPQNSMVNAAQTPLFLVKVLDKQRRKQQETAKPCQSREQRQKAGSPPFSSSGIIETCDCQREEKPFSVNSGQEVCSWKDAEVKNCLFRNAFVEVKPGKLEKKDRGDDRTHVRNQKC